MTNISDMLDRLERAAAAGASILDLMIEAGLDPKKGFRGGNWTFVNFNGLMLDGANFKEARVFGATFVKASVKEADFCGAEGATPTKGPALGLFGAANWRDAKLDDYQRLALLYRDHRENPRNEPFPIKKFIQQGFINSTNYLEFMRKSGDYIVAREIYELVKAEGVGPNKYAITELVCLCENHDRKIDELYQEALKDRVEVDSVLLNCMADSYSDVVKADLVRSLFDLHGVKVSEYYYNIMINKAKSREQAEEYISKMRGDGILPGSITVNSLLMKMTQWDDRQALILSMRGLRIPIRIQELNNLLLATNSKNEMRRTLELISALKIDQDITSFNIRMNKRKNLHEVKALFREAVSAGFLPDIYTQAALMRKAHSLAQICEVMTLLRPFDIDIFNEQTIRRLIRTSPDPMWSATRNQGMEMSGFTPEQRVKALVAHWIDPDMRQFVLESIFY